MPGHSEYSEVPQTEHPQPESSPLSMRWLYAFRRPEKTAEMRVFEDAKKDMIQKLGTLSDNYKGISEKVEGLRKIREKYQEPEDEDSRLLRSTFFRPEEVKDIVAFYQTASSDTKKIEEYVQQAERLREDFKLTLQDDVREGKIKVSDVDDAIRHIDDFISTVNRQKLASKLLTFRKRCSGLYEKGTGGRNIDRDIQDVRNGTYITTYGTVESRQWLYGLGITDDTNTKDTEETQKFKEAVANLDRSFKRLDKDRKLIIRAMEEEHGKLCNILREYQQEHRSSLLSYDEANNLATCYKNVSQFKEEIEKSLENQKKLTEDFKLRFEASVIKGAINPRDIKNAIKPIDDDRLYAVGPAEWLSTTTEYYKRWYKAGTNGRDFEQDIRDGIDVTTYGATESRASYDEA